MLKLFVMAQILRGRMADLLSDRKGVTAMEYGIIAATTVAAIGAVIGGVTGPLTTLWTDIIAQLKAAAP